MVYLVRKYMYEDYEVSAEDDESAIDAVLGGQGEMIDNVTTDVTTIIGDRT